MRTKTILLSAAALAAGLLSSQAQSNVYSLNIVGYANTVLLGNGKFTLVANPFDNGSGNQVTNVLNDLLPKQTQVLTWNGLTFNLLQKGGTPPSFPATTVTLPPGVGFFVRNGAPGSGAPDVTNTWVGSVIVNVGSSVNSSVPVGFSLQGSPIPYAGDLATSGLDGGNTNMNFGAALTKQSQILTWNLTGQTYNIAQKGGTPATWGASATVGVAEGFFVNNKNGPATNVVEILNP